MRTQVAIIGAGPAGLVLAHLLHLKGIDSWVLERQTRSHIEQRIRAGVLEPGTVDLLQEVGLADRLMRERMVHEGLELLFDGVGHRLPLAELAGREITIYGQHELVKDLVAARLATGRPLLFEVSHVTLQEVQDRPRVTFVHNGLLQTLECDYIAGCDGFHGVSRESVPYKAFEHHYPYAWLGVLAQAPPSSDELIYAHHPRGFALHSMRSPQLTRLYLQVDPSASLDSWTDQAIWAELRKRLARKQEWQLNEGPIVERSITALRSFVAEPMQHGKLFLAGDAAHIVPATGAKGLNLAIADVAALASLLEERKLDAYTETCLRRVWRVQHFSWWMTSMLHRGADTFTEKLQLSQLRYLTTSRTAAQSFAENYVGIYA